MPARRNRGSCFLDSPSERYEDSFLEGAGEFHQEGHLDSTYAEFLSYDLRRLQRQFGAFVRDLRELGKSKGRKNGYRDCVFWLIDDGHYIGQISIRAELGTAYLMTYGGHIGYSIRPSRRRMGYGELILALGLEKCPAMALTQVLVTCDSDNLASKKIIERNGGRFESAMDMDADTLRAEGRGADRPAQKLRYWIDPPSVSGRQTR